MVEVRRERDGELCGFVTEQSGRWLALTVFGGHLGSFDSRDEAVALVRDTGLGSMAERWQLRRRGEANAEVVCIQEADPEGVTLALAYYSLPGVPTLRLSRAELELGAWELFR